ncbi:MAG: glutathione S-transferase [Robiginitomaculum sp.]|nr:MAG: glutathione S-transferase [Robiginitomaculum sp.]
MAERPILYSFRRCPYAMRARMAITISQTPVRLREVLLRAKPPEMLAHGETVPVLVDGDAVIAQSLDIMHWALAKHDPENWLISAKDPLIAQNDGAFKHHLDRYKYHSRYADTDAMAHRAEGLRHLENLNARLKDAPFLAGDQRGFVDVALFPFVRQFRIPDMAWFDALPLMPLRTWLAGMMGSALFEGVMVKYPVWKETGQEIEFPRRLMGI